MRKKRKHNGKKREKKKGKKKEKGKKEKRKKGKKEKKEKRKKGKKEKRGKKKKKKNAPTETGPHPESHAQDPRNLRQWSSYCEQLLQAIRTIFTVQWRKRCNIRQPSLNQKTETAKYHHILQHGLQNMNTWIWALHGETRFENTRILMIGKTATRNEN